MRIASTIDDMAVTGPITKVDHPRVALILVEALFFGEKRTAKHWDITTRTIRNYRYMLESNDELSAIFHAKRSEFESDWAHRIPTAIIAGIDFISEAAKEADPKDPFVIKAIADAIKTLAEVGIMKEIMDARLSSYDSEDRTGYRQVDSISETVS